MASNTQQIWLAGIDPVPLRLTVAADASLETVLAAAGMPPSSFVQTIRPYRLQQRGTDTYELVIGPEGYGAVLLEALRWLARAAAAGILAAVSSEQLAAFVQHYLDTERPEWRFEELTIHGAAFIRDRYQRAAEDPGYQQGLADHRQDEELAVLVAAVQQWVTRNAVAEDEV